MLLAYVQQRTAPSAIWATLFIPCNAHIYTSIKYWRIFKKMDGLLFRVLKRGQFLCERYLIGHQSIFPTNAAARTTTFEPKRDVIHTLRVTGGG
jgi:hypothetical protein